MHRAVFFDAGGTLLTTKEPAPHLYAKTSYRYGCSASPLEIEKQFFHVWRTMNGLSGLQGPLAHKQEREFWSSFVRRVFEPFGPLNRFDAFIEELHVLFAEAETWTVFPDARLVLERLRREGVPMVVVSNWDSQLPGLLERLEVKKYFSAVLASSVVGWAKPAREIFDRALDVVQLPAGQVIHVGDSPVDDVAGPRQVGIRGILLDRTGTFQGEGVTAISDLSGLLPYVLGGSQ